MCKMDEELIAKLEAKGFHGTIDRLKRGDITIEQARAELGGDNSHIKIPSIELPDPYEVAAELKRCGVHRMESWTRWAQKTSLRPGMDTKDWYKI